MQISLVSKEVIITCGIFLLTFLLGAHLLDSLNIGKGDMVTTAAVAVNPLDDDVSQGAVIKKGKRGVLGLFSDEDKDDKKGLRELEKRRKRNLITGNVIGAAETAFTEDIVADTNVVQSTYAVKPDFAISSPSSVSFSAFSDAFYRQRTSFFQQVKDCLAERQDTAFLSLCIQQTLQEDAFKDWLTEDKCETPEEQVFYDFVERLDHCFTSQNSCLCQFFMDYERGYGAGSYGFTLSPSADGLLVQLLDSDLAVVFPGISFTSSLAPVESKQSLTYSITYADQDVTQVYFGLQQPASSTESFSVIDLFSSPVSSLVTDKQVYILKEGGVATFLTAADFAEREDQFSPCVVPEKPVYKFCYPVGDALHMFAMDFG